MTGRLQAKYKSQISDLIQASKNETLQIEKITTFEVVWSFHYLADVLTTCVGHVVRNIWSTNYEGNT